MQVAPGRVVGNAISMGQLVSALSQSTDRLVIDRTGLTGLFNIELQWSATPLSPTSDRPATPDDLPILITAVQEQLGLRFEATNAAIEVVVVDRADQPSAN